ncbi:MAG: MFS transporter [Allosphingosinicella sp.]|uniref:MFS transporter n=1 Tax=Allosphingosinicella sp. TaxID=2823234 RepID=UPI00393D468F
MTGAVLDGDAVRPVSGDYVVDVKRDRKVIIASSLGTVFEWYDFFIYGTLAITIGRLFFPADNPTVQFLLALASFAVGFGFRPLGAVLFGYLGDKLGRKYTFLITITLMGGATAAVGLVPTYASIGIAAPLILIFLRILQGLALGGEYGGAAIYVAEHAPPGKRGFYTSFIQASVAGGFLLSLVVVLGCQWSMSAEAWAEWGWRLPFLFSIVLLAISLWIRMKLEESPVFQAMKQAGGLAKNPLKESFATRRNTGRILVAMIGVAAGLTVIWYTAQFQTLYFLQNAMRVEETLAKTIIGASAVVSLVWFILFGWLSDRIGRRKPILIGYVLTLVLLFPMFHIIANAANPSLAEASARAPIVVQGPDCSFNPFATKGQATECGRLLDYFSKRGIHYDKLTAPAAGVTIGGQPVADTTPEGLDAALAAAGYSFETVRPGWGAILTILFAIVVLGVLSGMTYGPVAALLTEMFPARVRYSSMSIPYHIGTGYFGGFLPFISQYIIAKTGDPFSGLWYTFGVVALALVVALIWLPETAGKELD